jgi:hypothetical protein
MQQCDDAAGLDAASFHRGLVVTVDDVEGITVVLQQTVAN